MYSVALYILSAHLVRSNGVSVKKSARAYCTALLYPLCLHRDFAQLHKFTARAIAILLSRMVLQEKQLTAKGPGLIRGGC